MTPVVNHSIEEIKLSVDQGAAFRFEPKRWRDVPRPASANPNFEIIHQLAIQFNQTMARVFSSSQRTDRRGESNLSRVKFSGRHGTGNT